jgi:hypothetical protein
MIDNRAKRLLLQLVAFLLVSVPFSAANAHIKWFAQFDVSNPPAPIANVLTPTFIWTFVASACAIYVFFVIDRYALKMNYLSVLDSKTKMSDVFARHFMRVCAGIFFISLWMYSYFYNKTMLLTPDLVTTSTIVPWLQLAVGLCAFWHRSAPLVGIGIIGFFGASLAQYGIYHMTDYLIFIGMAYFFLVSDLKNEQWRDSGFTVLYAGTGFTFLWAAIEKFAYPQWTFPMLSENPGLLMGFTPSTFMIISGFMEFNLVFLMLSAASVLTRKISLALETIFIMATFKFGIIDAVGHWMFIAILFVLLVRGPTNVGSWLVLREKNTGICAAFMTGLYFIAFVMIFIFYYGFHYYYYGN